MSDDDDWTADLEFKPTPRLLRMTAHYLFDPIWKSGRMSRSQAYRELAERFGCPEPEAHFKHMSGEMLEQIIPVISAMRADLGV